MKKTILTLAIALGASVGFAQTGLTSKLAKASSAVTTANNYASQASTVSSKLNTVLSLTGTKPKVATIVTDYLKNKANLSSLATTDASAYTSKLTSLNTGMFSKLKTALTAAQYAKLLGLKTSSSTDALSSLFL